MKNDEAPENAEVKTDVQLVKKAKTTKPKKEKKPASGARLPLLPEFAYTLSTLALIFLALAIMITSLLAGASLFTVVLRTGVAIIVVGGLLMLISSQISSGLLFAVRIEQEEAEKLSEKEPVVPPVNQDANVVEA
jgi:hypothetical protein